VRLGLDVRVVRGHGRVGVAERPAPDLRVNSGVTRQAGGRVASLVELDHRQSGQRRQALEPARYGIRLMRRAVAPAEVSTPANS
jgi:hypothetical protein